VKLVALGEISQIHSKQRNVAIANEDLHNGNIFFRPGFLILRLASQLVSGLLHLWTVSKFATYYEPSLAAS
jgi:hypothetical protein